MAYKLDEGATGQPRMRSLIHRRHSLREPGEDRLSGAGVALARRVGAASGRFDRVVTSPKVRAVQTALAMGYAVDAQRPELGEPEPSIGRFLDRAAPSTFHEYVRWSTEVAEVGAAGARLAQAWGEELDQVPDGSRLLMISHSGVIELGAAGALPDGADGWGATLAPLEGVQLDRVGGRWVSGAVLRRPD
jgi:broad specificity phosphatase PhoE